MHALIEQLDTIAEMWGDYMWAMTWQLAVVVALVWVVTQCARRMRASLRHALWCLVLVKVVLPPTLSLPFGLAQATRAIAPGFVSGKAVDAQRVQMAPVADRLAAQPAGATVERMHPRAKRTAPPVPPAEASLSLSANTWLLVAWVGICVVLAGRLISRQWRMSAHVRGAKMVGGAAFDALMQECHEVSGVRRPIRAKATDRLPAPAAWGLFRPTVLLPQWLVEDCAGDPGLVRGVLLHEIAHVRRRDLWMNAAQLVAQIAYFFHPLIWVANYYLRREREQACDDQVLLWLSQSESLAEARRQYASGLFRVVELMPRRDLGAVGLVGMAEGRSAIGARIQAVLRERTRIRASVGALGLIAVALFGAMVLPLSAADAPRTAQSDARPANKKEAPQRPQAAAKSVIDLATGTTTYTAQVVARDTSEPLPEVEVTIWDSTRGHTVVTNANGRFTAKRAPAGRCRVWPLKKAGYVVLPPGQRLGPPHGTGDTYHETIRMDRSAGVSGVVLLPEGQPAAGFPLKLGIAFRTRDGFDSNIKMRLSSSNQAGRFQFDSLYPGGIELVARDDGQGLFGIWHARIAAGQHPKDIRLQIRRGSASVAGKVIDINGQPAADVRVSLVVDTGFRTRLPAKRLGTSTSEDGSFLIEHAPPGRYVMTTLLEQEGETHEHEALELSEGRRSDPLTLRLPFSIRHVKETIDGTVVDEAIRPITGARVHAWASWDTEGDAGICGWATPWPAKYTVKTDESGRFSLRPELAARAKHLLISDAPGHSIAQTEYILSGTKGLTIRLTRAGTLTGRLLDHASGKPLAGADVRARCIRFGRPRELGELERRQSYRARARADQDGRFCLSDLEPGPYQLRIDGLGWRMKESEPVQIVAGKETTYDWHVQRAETRTVAVVDKATGDPIPNALLVGSHGLSARADANGFVQIPEGYRSVLDISDPPGWLSPAGSSNSRERIAADMIRNRRIELERAAQQKVRVVRTDGRPVHGATVHAMKLASPQKQLARYIWAPRSRLTDTEGLALIDDIPPDRPVMLTAKAKGYAPAYSEKLTLGPGERRNLCTLTLDRGGSLEIFVPNADGTPVSAAWVELQYRLSGEWLGAGRHRLTGPQPFVLHNRPPVRFRLKVQADGLAPQELEGDAPARGEVRKVVVGPPDGNVLRGVLLSGRGEPRAHVRLRVRVGSRQAANAVTGSDGRFEVHGLGEGRVRWLLDGQTSVGWRPIAQPEWFTEPSGQTRNVTLR